MTAVDPQTTYDLADLITWKLQRIDGSSAEERANRDGTPERVVAETAVGLVRGYCRGVIPGEPDGPAPDDVVAVCFSVAVRIWKSVENTGELMLERGNAQGFVPISGFLGFLITEQLILNRYRQTTC